MCDLQKRVIPNAKEAERPDKQAAGLTDAAHAAIARAHEVSTALTEL